MNINFPSNCNNEGSRWSFCIKLNEVLRIEHNVKSTSLSLSEFVEWEKNIFMSYSRTIFEGRNEQIAISKEGAHWNPRIPDHVSNGIINYPPGLNQDNEGSRGSFLIGVRDELFKAKADIEGDDVKAIQEALNIAEQDAITAVQWNPTLGDIDG